MFKTPARRKAACLLWGATAWLGLHSPTHARPLVPPASLQRRADAPFVEQSDRAASAAPVRLANGLRLSSWVIPGAPLTHVSIVYDLPGEFPSSHVRARLQVLQRILPALGTRHLSAAARDRLWLTADTSFERMRATVTSGELILTVTIPPDALPLALFIEADRMGFGADTITQALVDEALANAKRSPDLDSELLQRWLDDAVGEAATCVSECDASTGVTVADLQDYMHRYLQPTNAVLHVEGDFDHQQLSRTIERTFGRLRVMRPPQLPRPAPAVACDEHQAINTNERLRFFLSWRLGGRRLGACRLDESNGFGMGAAAHWLERKLSETSRDSCSRVWAAQSVRSSRFTLGCETTPHFDRAHWVNHVTSELRRLRESLPFQELQLALAQHAVQALDPLGLPEQRAAASAPSESNSLLLNMIEGAPVPFRVTPVTVREMLTDCLARAAESSIELRTHVTSDQSAKLSRSPSADQAPRANLTPSTPVTNVDDPLWLRPPRKSAPTQVVFPQLVQTRVADNLRVQSIEQAKALVDHMVLRFLWRNANPDPALTALAAQQLLNPNAAGTSLLERLWNEAGVRASITLESNSVVVELTGTEERLPLALPLIRDALQAAAVPQRTSAAVKRAVLANEQSVAHRSLLDQLRARLGSPLVARWDKSRLTAQQLRMNTFTPKQVAEFWSDFATRGELAVAVLGRVDNDRAAMLAAQTLPQTWQRRSPLVLRTDRYVPRNWILQENAAPQVQLELVWPAREKLAEQRAVSALVGIARAAKALGNLNAARPHNRTTQFTLNQRSLPESEVVTVSVAGVELDRVSTVLRELDGYFARLVERIDFAQLLRLGAHDLQRQQLAWFATPSRTLSLLDEWALSGAPRFEPIENFASLGSAPREELTTVAAALRLDRATIIAKGPADGLEGVLRAVNPGECVVVP